MVSKESKIPPLLREGNIDWSYVPNAVGLTDADVDEEIKDKAVEFITDHQPSFMMVHFGNVDTRGHMIGWRSREQKEALETIDGYVGEIMDAIYATDMCGNFLIMITADHGGCMSFHSR